MPPPGPHQAHPEGALGQASPSTCAGHCSSVPPAWHPPLLPSKRGLWIWYRRKGRREKLKGSGSGPTARGGRLQCSANVRLGGAGYAGRRPVPTAACLPGEAGSASRGGQWGGVEWSGGESDYVLLLNRNWNETKHFQISPDPPRGAAGSCTAQAPQPPSHS